ncbi:hypothetical protein [Tistrella sp.]|uniref:hypothetical protein n=1 Tax=Tistrella sp. TaxID=2024861 RepID=UPI0025CE78DD|nr:hypothetical protein [Tistrella sp.]
MIARQFANDLPCRAIFCRSLGHECRAQLGIQLHRKDGVLRGRLAIEKQVNGGARP